MTSPASPPQPEAPEDPLALLVLLVLLGRVKPVEDTDVPILLRHAAGAVVVALQILAHDERAGDPW